MNKLLRSELRYARITKRLSQQEVARLLGVKTNTISNWETGKSEPNIDSFMLLCSIYEIDCNVLLSDVLEKIIQTKSPGLSLSHTFI